MGNLTTTVLGIIQGLTEFLPISSSGHLVLFQNIFGFREPELMLDISLHLGTLLAVCVFFRSDLKEMIRETWSFSLDIFGGKTRLRSASEHPHVMLTLWVLTGTVPTAMIGLFFKSPLEALFGDVKKVGIMLLCTGLILAATKFISSGHSDRRWHVGFMSAIAIGIAQGLAIIPGISRSGTTIVCGILCGVEREMSARFSFLLSVPAIIGATTLQLGSEGLVLSDVVPLSLGLLSSAIVGFIALKILMGIVRVGRLFYFAPYCWALGLLIIFY